MITAHTPKLSANGTIELIVKFPWLDQEVPFSASKDDSEPYGRDLFARAIVGEFGAIGDLVAPIMTTPRSLSSLQFMDRFTEDEQLSIVTATMNIASVKLWYDRMLCAEEIVYKDSRTLAGLQALVSAGLITQTRMDEILPEAWR